MLLLDSQEIHLWLCFVDELHEHQLLQRYRLLLTQQELQTEQRYHFPKDRHRYLVTRALVRTVLSRYAPVTPQQWTFASNAHGKPAIANREPLAQGITFNVSHTQGLIVIGVCRRAALGVDVENLRTRRALLDAADVVFSSEEALAIARLPTALQHERFFQYWTLKEAYLKACGTGMSVPLTQFGFEFLPQDRVRLSLHVSLPQDASRWRFWQFKPSPDHLLSVCAEHGGSCASEFVFRKTIPLGADELLRFTPVLTSQ